MSYEVDPLHFAPIQSQATILIVSAMKNGRMKPLDSDAHGVFHVVALLMETAGHALYGQSKTEDAPPLTADDWKVMLEVYDTIAREARQRMVTAMTKHVEKSAPHAKS